MASLEELLAQQQNITTSVFNALANFKKLGQEKMTQSVTRQRLANLNKNLERCRTLDGQLMAKVEEANRPQLPYFKLNRFAQCEDAYNEAADFMAEVLSKFDLKQEAPSSAVSTQSANVISTSGLPTMSLPTFDGSLDQWESFRDRFTALLIRDSTLSDVQRMHYLLSCVTGDASQALNHMAITADNFNVAWRLLSSRYENSRRLINVHLHALFDIAILKAETAEGLRSLRDRASATIGALKNLRRPVDQWSDIFVFMISQRLDPASRKAWEFKLGNRTEYPEYAELENFLDSRIIALETMPRPDTTDLSGSERRPSKLRTAKTVASHAAGSTSLVCPMCNINHLLYQCPRFLAKSPSQRLDLIKKWKRCVNCFSSGHLSRNCTSLRTCKTCHKKHHTLLHLSAEPRHSDVDTSSGHGNAAESTVAAHATASTLVQATTVLLATARIRVYSPTGRYVKARALLDQGSAATIISAHLAQCLQLSRIRRPTRITGIGDAQTTVRHAAHITVTPSACATPAFTTTALILHSLTPYVPNPLNLDARWPTLSGLELADPDPINSDPIHIIIGADLYGLLLREGFRPGSDREPTAQNTALGWILSGPLGHSPQPQPDTVQSLHCSIDQLLDHDLRRFWELEEIPGKKGLSPEDAHCEEHFRRTHSRRPDGHYVVRLPLKSPPPIAIGDSRSAAISCLSRMERRLHRDINTARGYQNFLEEYERLGHMSRIREIESPDASKQVVYIPHHAVFKENSDTSRIRVVFNASCRTTNGTSLNDHMLTGPKLQTDLTSVMLQWRRFRYVYIADIEKMYRQIFVDSRDTDLQRILWRPSPTDSIHEYRLLTVTYGTASAPYLAMRVLRQLADDDGASFPLALPILQQHIYVDDCIFGTDDLNTARETRDQLVALLAQGGFRLRKWASNSATLLEGIDPVDHGLICAKELRDDENLKVLGIAWHPDRDEFRFSVNTTAPAGSTKRAILSATSKLFDPLGWATPVVIVAKILMQQLWEAKCDWDDPVPADLLRIWLRYYSRLSHLEHVAVPRWVGLSRDTVSYELHGFSDASTRAYAAAVYLRVVSQDESVHSMLMTAKSKVAPIKTISVPRLELCAALLLARLMRFVRDAGLNTTVSCHCWTDSTITLAWLSQPPTRWKTFVANRVSEIHSVLPGVTWRHVPTHENPADYASRGIDPEGLSSHDLWWNGPSWLISASDHWPNNIPPPSADIPREEKTVVPSFTASTVDPWELSRRFSSWAKLLRVTAYVVRFTTRARSPSDDRPAKRVSQPPKPYASPALALSPSEIRQAKLVWLRRMQLELFPREVACLSGGLPLPKSSPLASLTPYLDTEGLVRVRGRLRHADLPTEVKYPIILRSHPLLDTIIHDIHHRALHAGSQLTLALLREEFWILRARTTVRTVLYRCVTCARERATVPTELMGDLPDVRVNRSTRAFVHTGTDYAGPISVRTAPGRGHKSHKAYIALFICMTTKAIHLELVSDYTANAFLAAFNRFVSRRGLPVSMYSDNGTTFQGAERELRETFADAVTSPTFLNGLATDGVAWHFLPPAAPHFGGLWEAGVRSVKHHLKRCIGCTTLTFEELATLLCRIEACLNSRPLAAVSENLDDYRALTPGHFLIGAPLTAIPEPSVLDINEHRLSRWQIIQRATEGFWKTWVNDYLHTLQQRAKWKTITRLAKLGQLVLLRNPLTPPSQWELGRITECHPGEDGLTRVVTVTTARSQYKRPLCKLTFLPIDINVANAEDAKTDGATPPRQN